MIIYVNKADYRSVAYNVAGLVWEYVIVEVPDDFSPGGKTYNPETGAWILDSPPAPSNAELRKFALAELSSRWTNDIALLNISWLAAAVNDGAGEETKKSAILAQIGDKRAQYVIDRAAIIAQYPED